MASPLHFFWDGTSAVLAVLVILAVDRTSTDLESAWVHTRAAEVTRYALFLDMTLLNGHGGHASPLWSLRWELWFSLLLPLYVWLGVRVRTQALPASALLIGLVAYGGYPWFQFLPVFGIGVLLAVRAEDLREAVSGFTSRRWFAVFTIAVLLISLPWLTRWLSWSPTLDRTLMALCTVGAAALVVAAMHAPVVRSFLDSPVLQYLGTISFALHLVHEPLVITIAAAFGEGMQWLSLPLAIAVSVVVADVFSRLVERPSHRLARIAGSRATAVRRRIGPPGDRTTL